MPDMSSSRRLLACGVFVSLARLADASSLVFTTDRAQPAQASVLADACTTYHGTYDGTSVYILHDDGCAVQPQDWLSSASIVPHAHHDGGAELVYVQKAALDSRVFGKHHQGDWITSLESHIEALYAGHVAQPASNQEQHVLYSTQAPPEVQLQALIARSLKPERLHQPQLSETSAFYSIPRVLVPFVDQLFPSTAVLVSVPSYPLPLSSSTASNSSSAAPEWLQHALRNVRYSPLTDALLNDIDPDEIQKDVRHLTNEDGKAGWRTRHSFTEGAKQAAQWIKHTVEKEGGAECSFHEHDYGFSPNVICTYNGTRHAEELVVLGAHYDSRGTFGHVRAPGGDDDASGTSALLALSRVFKAYNLQFQRSVALAFFSGEEQGLWGSRGYARQLKESGRDVRFMLQADMLGYHAPGERLQMALPDKYDTIEARWLVGNLSTIYVPELQVGTTPACCSDHQSFDQQGFVSTWVFERNGPIADPKYHNSEDVSDREGYDFEQVAAITRVMLATVLEVAGFDL